MSYLVESALKVLAQAGRPLKAYEIAAACGELGHVVDGREIGRLLAGRLGLDVARDDFYRFSLISREHALLDDLSAEAPSGSLTIEQSNIALASPEDVLLVIAPAGTGKTHTLISRLQHLTEECELGGAQEVLLLSFSRNAVAEIRRRLSAASGSDEASYISAKTFDRFAYDLLALDSPTGLESDSLRDYDATIQRAIELIGEEGTEAREYLRAVRHLVVDETQDLVGCRADLVLAILSTIGGGATLLGDPAQGVYDFTLKEQLSRTTTGEFFDEVREMAAQERKLGHNFRAKSPLAKRAAKLGDCLRVEHPDYVAAWHDVTCFIQELPKYPLEELADRVSAESSNAVILCHSNSQCLAVASELHRLGVPCWVRRRAHESLPPAWLAAAFPTPAFISREQFEQALDELLESSPAFAFVGDRALAWNAIRALTGGAKLSMRRLASQLSSRTLPADLGTTRPEAVTISTVHRAKGLEYGLVLLVGLDDERRPERAALPEATRVRYVAVSRASHDIVRVKQSSVLRGLWKDKELWPQRHRKPQKGRPRSLEFLVSDIDREHPPQSAKLDVRETLSYVLRNVRQGDDVVLRRTRAVFGGKSRDTFAVEHKGTPIAFCSSEWVRVLHTLSCDDVQVVTGLFIADFFSGVAQDGSGEELPPFWLLPVLAGLARLI